MLLVGPVFIRGPRGCGFCLVLPLLPASLEVGVLSVEDSFAFAGSWGLVRLMRLVWTWISDSVPCDFADFLGGLSKSVGDLSSADSIASGWGSAARRRWYISRHIRKSSMSLSVISLSCREAAACTRLRYSRYNCPSSQVSSVSVRGVVLVRLALSYAS